METKAALITGGGTGIGRAVALELGKMGIRVAVNYSRSANDAEATAAKIREMGPDAFTFRADVADDDAVRAMVAGVIARFGRLDYLVNSAGVTDFVPLPDLDALQTAHWDRVMSVNVRGVFQVCRAAAPHLKSAGGSIVNIASVGGITGVASSMAYAASKAAAISLTKSLATVLAPEVRVNALAPGVVTTRWVDGFDHHVEWGRQSTPLGRVCDAEDVAAVAVPLLTSMPMVTGQTWVVDGGKVMR